MERKTKATGRQWYIGSKNTPYIDREKRDTLAQGAMSLTYGVSLTQGRKEKKRLRKPGPAACIKE
eukprot:782216-Pelagomonas_calceolata.AAC.1